MLTNDDAYSSSLKIKRKIGFDTEKYLQAQVQKILDRVGLFDKLYLEFGGKLRYDNHASRVLLGFEVDTKIKMLQQLDDVEMIHCISAKDIEQRKIRRDFGLAYEDQILKDINDLHELGLDVSAVVINRYNGEISADKFKQKLENREIRVFVHYEIPGYLKNLELVVSDEGYGKQDYVDTKKKIVVVTAPGPGSGKMSFCMAQLYNDRKRGIKSGFSKFETFPIWNLPLNHPVNVAYEAATADLGDFNLIDPFHKEAYATTAINYNRDVENFDIMKKIIEKVVDEDDPMAKIKSPTDMGVNMAKEGIIDDAAVRAAAEQEIIRRHFRYNREFVEGATTRDTLDRMEKIMDKVGVKPEHRSVVLPAREAAEDAKRRKKSEGKGYRGVFCGAAIELDLYDSDTIIVTGKNSPFMHAESAALLNAAKILSGVPDETYVISRDVIDRMNRLKEKMGLGTSLDVKEVLDALAASAVSDQNADKCIHVLDELYGCEMHTTHLMNGSEEIPLKQLGLNVTTDAKRPFPNAYNR